VLIDRTAAIARGRRHDGRQEIAKRRRIGPTDFDFEHLYPGSIGWRHADNVLCCRHETRSRLLGVVLQLCDLSSAVSIMIGKCSGADQHGTEAAQAREEFFGTPDPCEGQQTRTFQPLTGNGFQHRQEYGRPSTQLGPVHTTGLRFGAQQNDTIGAGEAASEAFAQRTRWDHPSVAKAVSSINDEERQGFGDCGVLKAVIEQYHAGAGRDRGADSGSAVAGDPARRTRCQQQRFIPNRRRVVSGGIDPQGPAEAPAIPARYDVHIKASGSKMGGYRQCDGGFAGPAGNQIADAYDRDRRGIWLG
jgi:hypothetical protein